jgi:branched-chain amino acid transport system ATP-binding protein
MLDVDKISGGYGKLRIVHDVCLRVDPGEIVAVLGPNGAGKSTTMKLIAGLLPMMSGSKAIDGDTVDGLPAHEMARRGLGLVAEGRWLFPGMSVQDNLLVGGYRLHGRRERHAEMERVMELFPFLHTRIRAQAGTLSGGEQQMVAIARALMARPSYLLLDEPSLGLAPIVVKQVYREVARLSELGIGVLVVEQNVDLVLGVASRGYVLREGRVVASSDSQDLINSNMIRSEYMGGRQAHGGDEVETTSSHR